MAQDFECEMCRKKFSTKFELNLHKRQAHFRNASTVCICGVACKGQSDLEQHKREKHEEREVAEEEAVVADEEAGSSNCCSICRYQYARKDTYIRHFSTLKHTSNVNASLVEMSDEEEEPVAEQRNIEDRMRVAQRNNMGKIGKLYKKLTQLKKMVAQLKKKENLANMQELVGQEVRRFFAKDFQAQKYKILLTPSLSLSLSVSLINTIILFYSFTGKIRMSSVH